jgi:Ca-activated chloride channel homolog
MLRTTTLRRFLLVSAISSGLITALFQHEVALHAQEAHSVTPARLSVISIDKKGRVMLDVKQEEFRILENGVEQKITHFSKDESPISYGLVVDNSGSLRYLISSVVDTAKEFIAGNREGDKTFVIRFVSSDKIIVKEDFTSDKAALINAIDSMFVEGGRTAVIDAVYLAAEKLIKHGRASEMRHRALIVLSDGEDRSSAHTLDDLLKLVRGSDIQIYCIGFGALAEEGGSLTPAKRERATTLLKRLASETDGQAYFPLKVSELQDALNEVQLHLRARTLIGYTTSPATESKSRRKIEVRINDVPGRDKRIAVALPMFVESNATVSRDRE